MEIKLSKGLIIKKITFNEYSIKDILTDKELVITITAKECMNYHYEIGEIVYYATSELRQEIGKLITPIVFIRNQKMSLLKEEFDIDNKYK